MLTAHHLPHPQVGPGPRTRERIPDSLADLEIATFAVDEVVEGTQTGWSDGRLTLALPQLAVGAGTQPALAEATVEVVETDSLLIDALRTVEEPRYAQPVPSDPEP